MSTLYKTSAPARKTPHPFAYTLLIVPFGASGGFVTVALAFIATRAGLTVAQGAMLGAAAIFPNVWKFFWSPIGDMTLSRKRWYLLSCLACAAGTFATAAVPLGPTTLKLMLAIILLTSVAGTFLAFAVEGIVASLTPPADRGNVSGWYQAGNLGGNGLGGGLGLLLLERTGKPWLVGTVLAAVICSCALGLLLVPEVAREEGQGGVWRSVRHVGVDVWRSLRARDGTLGAVLCFLPVATGAAQGVLVQAEVAAKWGAGEHEVALVQGFVAGLVGMAGCLAGGWVCQRLSGRISYAVFGLMMACVTVAMAYSPMTPTMYVVYNIAYAFVTGLSYAAFSALVFDAIGQQGHAATKYNGFASLSNTPIWYMGLLLAWAHTRWGAKGMLLVESALGLAAIALFAAVTLAVGRPKATANAT